MVPKGHGQHQRVQQLIHLLQLHAQHVLLEALPRARHLQEAQPQAVPAPQTLRETRVHQSRVHLSLPAAL